MTVSLNSEKEKEEKECSDNSDKFDNSYKSDMYSPFDGYSDVGRGGGGGIVLAAAAKKQY